MQPDLILERGMPAAVDAERYVLGSVMLDSQQWRDISGALTAGDFSIEKHRRIYGRMEDLAKRGEPIDRVTLCAELMKACQLESVDGLSYLVSLDEGLPEITNIDAYVRMIQDAAILRRAIVGCQSLMNECLSRASETPEILSGLERLSRDLQGELGKSTTLSSPAQVFQSAGVGGIFADGRTAWIKTPWERLNNLINGFEAGQMIVIGGRPGSGKSVFLNQCAWTVSETGKKAVIISLEMSNASLLRRYIASRASVALHRVRSGHMDQDQRQNAQAALFDATENPNLRMADKLFTVPAIRAALSRMAAREKIDLIVIDYLQLLTTGNARQSLTEEVTQISRAVKLLAVEFGCPVLIGSQLSRESEKEGREPRLSDLRNSGSLEQDADTVIFPHPSKIQDTESVDLRVEFIVAKQRDGRIGRVPMTFERPYVRFSEL
jgi:replicative DNA helicase